MSEKDIKIICNNLKDALEMYKDTKNVFYLLSEINDIISDYGEEEFEDDN